MNIVEALKKAKQNDISAINWLIKQYEYYIYYKMKEYNIKDKKSCYDEVVSNLYKVIYYFKL